MTEKKKTVNKKAAKKKVKPRIKTVVTHSINFREIYECSVKCPYCGESNYVETEYEPPTEDTCIECGKKYKIKVK